MNQIILMGRFVADPVIPATNTGKQLCKFTLAVKRPHNSKAVDYINILAWESTGIFIANHFKKGQRIAVSGYLIVRLWTDKDGKKRKTHEVVVNDVYFADSAIKASDENVSGGDNKEIAKTADEEDEPDCQYQCTDDDFFNM